jgi:hypothetical protein
MTKKMFAVVAWFSVSAGLAMAQNPQIHVSVPFDFTAGASRLPAGDYVVSTGMSPNSTWIRNENTKESVILFSHPVIARASAAPGASLMFHRYGDQYFLHQVWTLSGDQGQELSTSRAESEEAAIQPRSTGTVVLAAKR